MAGWSGRVRGAGGGRPGWWPAAVLAAVVALLAGRAAPALGLGGSAAAGGWPVQGSGSAAGRSHLVSSAATGAAVDLSAGRAAGFVRPRGALPDVAGVRRLVYGPAARPGEPVPGGGVGAAAATTGPALAGVPRGFDPTSSVEQPARRSVFGSVYANPDGSTTQRFYTRPVHYRRADGSWADIDPTLGLRGDGRFHAAANAFDLSVAASAADPTLASVGLDAGHQLGWSLAGAGPAPAGVSGDRVSYPSALPGVSVGELSTTTGVAESLVLASKAAPSVFIFPLQLRGLTASVDSAGGVSFSDSARVVRARMPAGSMQDANVDPHSGDGAISYGVTYALVGYAGGVALRVSLDTAWLDDPARVFPVTVDPTVNVSDGADDTFVLSPYRADNSGSTELHVGTYDGGGNVAKAFMHFPGVNTTLANDYIEGVSLNLYEFWSWSCTGSQLWVHQVTSPWSGSTATTYPGPSTNPNALAAPSLAAGYSAGCPARWQTINLGAAGVSLVSGWAHGSIQNDGLDLEALTTDDNGWKKFDSAQVRGGAPYLAVTYSTFGASYCCTGGSLNPPVYNNQNGALSIRVSNGGNATWPANGSVRLAYHVYDANNANQLVWDGLRTMLPAAVGPNGSISLNAAIGALAPGSYWLRFDMVDEGVTWFSQQGVPTYDVKITVPDLPPQITATSPDAGVLVTSTTPVLSVAGVDPDNWPNKGLSAYFTVDDAATGARVATSGWTAAGVLDWSPPAGALVWGRAYSWRVFLGDTVTDSGTGGSALTPVVPQTGLWHGGGSGALLDGGVEPVSGDFTMTSRDATEAGAGPPLALTRTFNSRNPGQAGVFGPGWLSVLDSRLALEPTGNAVITFPDGHQERYGANPDGSFTAPYGSADALSYDSTNRRYLLATTAGTSYTFGQPQTGGYGLTAITDPNGRALTVGYDPGGQPTSLHSTGSGRTLTVGYTGGLVTSVSTDPPAGGQPGYSWTYRYTGGLLTAACDPASTGCTGYGYTSVNHYPVQVGDAAPQAYWPLADPAGSPTAADAVLTNGGSYTGSYHTASLGQPGPLPGSSATAAGFDGASSYLSLPTDLVHRNLSYTVELWFKTTRPGVLLSEANQPVGTTPSDYNLLLYVGADGHLSGGQWFSGFTAPRSSAVVDDGNWHQAALTASANSQTLFLDGAVVATTTGVFSQYDMHANQIGVGYGSSGWADTPCTGFCYFTGSIGQVSFYQAPLDVSVIAAHRQTGATAGHAVSTVTTPAGRTYATVGYDTATDTAASVSGFAGSWQRDPPVAAAGNTASVSMIDGAGNRTGYTYNRQGQLLQRTDSMGTRTWTYNSGGFLASLTDGNQNTLSWTTDGYGNILSRTSCRSKSACDTAYASYYPVSSPRDPRVGKLTQSRDARSAGPTDNTYLDSYGYDPAGNLTAATSPPTAGYPNGRSTLYAYTAGTEPAVGGGTEPAGLLASTTLPGGGVTAYAYTAAGDTAKVSYPSGLVDEYGYDGLGRPVSRTEISTAYPSGLLTRYTYTADGHLAGVDAPAVTNPVTGVTHSPHTGYGYDPDGDLTSRAVSDTSGGDPTRSTVYGYDSAGRLASIRDPAGDLTSYGYDTNNHRTSLTSPNQVTTDFAYNPRGELTETSIPGWTCSPVNPCPATTLVTESRAYDPAGRLASVTDAMGRTTSYTYYTDDRTDTVSVAGVAGPNNSTHTVVLHAYGYDPAGNLTTDQTANRTITTDDSFDQANQLTATTLDPAGLDRTTAYGYDANGNRTSVTRTAAGFTGSTVTDYGYDPMNRLTSISVHNDATPNLTTSYQRDQRGLVTKITDPNGNVTTVGYDPAGRAQTLTEPAVPVQTDGNPPSTTSPTATTGYDTFGEPTQVRDPNGFVTTTSYDPAGRVSTVTEPAYTPPGSTSPITPSFRYGYDADSNLTSVTNPDPQTTRYGYDQADRLVSRTDPTLAGQSAGGVWTDTLDADGEITATADPTGAATAATYDALGRQLTATRIERDPAPTVGYTTSYGYDDASNLTSISRPGGQQTTAGYNPAGQLTTSTDPAGDTTGYGYDLAGRPTSSTDPTGRVTTVGYDQAGRPVSLSQTDPTGKQLRAMSWVNDRDGNPTAITDYNGHTTSYGYDALNRLTSRVVPVNASHGVTTGYGYDADGHQTLATDGDANPTVTTYNSLGLPESVISPATGTYPAAADRTTTTSYDPAGRVASISQPGGIAITDSYDTLGRLTGQTGTGAEAPTAARSLGYNLRGDLTSIDTPTGEQTFSYDDRRLLTAATGPEGTASYSYGPNGWMSTRTDAAGTASFGYDPAGRLHTATDPLTNTSQTRDYYPDSRLHTISYGTGGDLRTLGYDGLGRLATDTLTTAGGATVAALGYR